MNYEEDEAEDLGIKYGEELRASSPRRIRDIAIRQVTLRVAKALFQTTMYVLSLGDYGSTRVLL
jgi:hypothetical protein